MFHENFKVFPFLETELSSFKGGLHSLKMTRTTQPSSLKEKTFDIFFVLLNLHQLNPEAYMVID